MSIEDGLKQLDGKKTDLIIVSSEELQSYIDFVVKFLTERNNRHGIYLALNKPAKTIKEVLGKKGISTEKIFFIDTITASVDSNPKQIDNVLYVPAPSDITGMSIAIGEFIAKNPGKKWLVIDALRTLKIYNAENVVVNFVKSLTLKAGDEVQILIITTKGKDKSLINRISPFFDDVIEVKDDK